MERISKYIKDGGRGKTGISPWWLDGIGNTGVDSHIYKYRCRCLCVCVCACVCVRVWNRERKRDEFLSVVCLLEIKTCGRKQIGHKGTSNCKADLSHSGAHVACQSSSLHQNDQALYPSLDQSLEVGWLPPERWDIRQESFQRVFPWSGTWVVHFRVHHNACTHAPMCEFVRVHIQ